MRARFAPSPTGFLHVGGARTALFNWLAVRNAGGTFILRSDDTDPVRSEQRFQDDILDSLRWLGLDWDEGIDAGGPHGSYRQSDRFPRYQEVATQLVERGAAYEDFCTPDEIEALRRQSGGSTPVVVRACDFIDAEETERRRAAGVQPAIRFEVPRDGVTEFTDLVRGDLRFEHGVIEDFVILRSDGSPTYHLASTVDDVDYHITHVIRGEDLLPSTPKHMMITRAMGGELATYAHLPLLHGADGKRLSKRHGDTAVAAYRDAGIVAEAMVNYLALLGWSPGADETIVPLVDMIERFDLGAVSRNPAVFDPDKLAWLNGVYIRDMGVGDFVTATRSLVEADLGRSLDDLEAEAFAAMAPLVQERAKSLEEVAGHVRFLFVDHIDIDQASWDKVMGKDGALDALMAGRGKLDDLTAWDAGSIEAALRATAEDLEMGAGKTFQPFRVAVTGSSVSPPLFESMEALGRVTSLARIGLAIERLRQG